jgi:hypothetical protein
MEAGNWKATKGAKKVSNIMDLKLISVLIRTYT